MAFGLCRFEVDEGECAPGGVATEAPQRQRRAFGLGALAGGSLALALVLCLRSGARVPGGSGAEKFAGLVMGPPGLRSGGRPASVAARRSGLPVTMSGGGSLRPGQATELDPASLAREVGAPDAAPLLVDLVASWLGPGKMIEPSVAELARKAGGGLRAARLDWEAPGARQLLQELGAGDCPTVQLSAPEVTTLPTVLLIKDGSCVAGFAGAPATLGELEAAVAEATGIQL